MKRVVILFLYYSIGFFLLIAKSLAAPIDDYHQCVETLNHAKSKLDQWVPDWYGELDRRYYHMRKGIEIIRSNEELLRVSVQRSPTKEGFHITANATKDCQAYLVKYKSYVRWSMAFLYTAVATALAAFVTVLLAPLPQAHSTSTEAVPQALPRSKKN